MNVLNDIAVSLKTRGVQDESYIENTRIQENNGYETPKVQPALVAQRFFVAASRLLPPVAPPVDATPPLAVTMEH